MPEPTGAGGAPSVAPVITEWARLTAHQRVFFDVAATYRAARKAYAATEATSTASMWGAVQ
jgi:proline racemase